MGIAQQEMIDLILKEIIAKQEYIENGGGKDAEAKDAIITLKEKLTNLNLDPDQAIANFKAAQQQVTGRYT